MACVSSRSPKLIWNLSRAQILLLGVLAALAMSIYIVNSARSNGLGFPLDDAWIHQTYARNLAERGEWAFVPGQPSAGATSPLWVALLAVGAKLGLAPYAGTFFLGWLNLWAIGLFGAAIFGRLAPSRAQFAVWVAALLITEFHLVWAAASGMETALFVAIVMAVFLLVLQSQAKTSFRNWLVLGLLVGLAVLVRPEGMTFLGPVFFVALASVRPVAGKAKTLLLTLVGFAILFVPYLFFNRAISESWWPNTLYAKQAEYASLLAQPFLVRLGRQLSQPLIGVGIVLLPGFLYYFYKTIKEQIWPVVGFISWIVGFSALFALRLPVVYQHGRYAMPIIPIFLVLGAAGVASWIQPKSKLASRRIISVAWLGAVALCAFAFFAIGIPTYSRDVAFINSEMVATAGWVKANTPADSVVAAHDIGALGYFSERRVLDLAGLVSPEVIPFVRDEDQLRAYLDAQRADYLVTFPSWYPQLVIGLEPIHETEPNPVWESMAVYRWAH